MLDRAIQAIAQAQSQAGATPALRKIIEVIEMETNNDWMDKYQTEESKAKVDARKHLWSPELQERVSRQWNELIADVEASLAEDRRAKSPRRWQPAGRLSSKSSPEATKTSPRASAASGPTETTGHRTPNRGPCNPARSLGFYRKGKRSENRLNRHSAHRKAGSGRGAGLVPQ